MTDTTATPSIPLLCQLNLRHHWHYETNPDDNHRYRRCVRCGKDDPRLGNPWMPDASGGFLAQWLTLLPESSHIPRWQGSDDVVAGSGLSPLASGRSPALSGTDVPHGRAHGGRWSE